MTPRIWIGPRSDPVIAGAIVAGGGEVVPTLGQADGVVWLDGDPGSFPRLDGRVRWVQLPGAGAERWVDGGLVAGPTVWTTAAGAYGVVVAEHALALVLACLREIPTAARSDRWVRTVPRSLSGSEVLVVGAGGIGSALIRLLEPFDVRVTVVTRSGREVRGAFRSRGVSDLDQLWSTSDVVVLAAPATAESRHLVGERALRALPAHAVLVNVGRGVLVDTDALVRALTEGRLGGAGLDVVDPEPLPPSHPLWRLPNVVITSHSANPPELLLRALAQRVRVNVERLAAGEDLVAPLDLRRGY